MVGTICSARLYRRRTSRRVPCDGELLRSRALPYLGRRLDRAPSSSMGRPVNKILLTESGHTTMTSMTQKSQPRKINAKQAAKDIEAGLPDTLLMEKYGLSERGLESLVAKLVAAGLLSDGARTRRGASSKSLPDAGWKCPACGKPRPTPVAECPDCGVIVAKYLAIHGSGEAAPVDGSHWPEAQTEPGVQSRGSSEAGPEIGHPNLTAGGNANAAKIVAGAASVAVAGMPSGYAAESVFQEEDNELADEVFPEPRTLDRQGKIILLTTPFAALLCFAIWWFEWTLNTFKTLVHEMGHAIFGWLFGYPSFPAFDILWGGGVTLHTERNPVLLAVVFAGFLALFYVYRANRATLAVLAALIAIYTLMAFTSIHSILILFMGHGTELLIAGIFLYRGLSGRAVVHAAERPLYAIIGFFLIFSDLAFAYRLISSASFREEYECAKGGCIDMDFVRIAADHLHVKVTAVAGFFLVSCLVVLLLAFLAFRYDRYLRAALAHLLTRKPDGGLTESGETDSG